jgi:branched-chain amino acid transport system substrate-binding protein
MKYQIIRKANLFQLLITLGAALLQSAAYSEPQAVKVGVMLCLSGDCAEWGTNGLKGVQLAADELNRKGGILGRRVELSVQDSRDTTPSHSVSAYRKLTQDKQISFIIGPTWTVGGMPIAPLIAKNKQLIVMSPSVGVKEFNESSDNIFNDWPHDEVATRAMADYAIKQGWKKGAIFGSQDPFYMTQSSIFEEEYTRRGGKIAAKVEPLPDSRELKAEALRIKAADPDFVVFTNYQADVIAKELSGIKFSKPILAVQMEKNRVKDAAGALEGVVFAMYETPAQAFQEQFRARFKAEPGISADTGYDALMVYAKSAEKAGTTNPSVLKQALRSTRNFSGASGTFSFNEKGAVDKSPVLWRVKGLAYERVTD